jgi:hypothetical protein
MNIDRAFRDKLVISKGFRESSRRTTSGLSALFIRHRAAPGEKLMVLVLAGSVDQSRKFGVPFGHRAAGIGFALCCDHRIGQRRIEDLRGDTAC